MNTIFFALLKYVHSAFLGEEVNVGILLCFPKQGRMEFRTSSVTRRLRLLYPNVRESQLRTYLDGITQRVERANREYEQYNSVEDFATFISQQLLIRDASVLQFGTIRQALAHSPVVADIVNYYVNLFFAENSPPPVPSVPKRHDEGFLRKQFSTFIRKKDPSVLGLLKKNVQVGAGTASVKFDYGWQNGATNLVKALSFDLSDKQEIDKKSFYCYGWLDVLAEKAKQENYQFDLLVARPTSRKLYKDYDNALSILQQSSAPKRLIVETALEEYTTLTVQALQDHRSES